jgi:hypothetical protein
MKISERANEISSKKSLQEVIENVFFEDATVFKTIRNSYDSITKRIQKAIEKNGGHSDY